MKGPHQRWVGLLALALPWIWVIQWKMLGFAFGVLFLWLCVDAMGLTTLGPGQLDNILPGLTLVFGWLPALIYMLFTLAVHDVARISARHESRLAEDTIPRKQSRRFQRALVGFAAFLAAVGVLRICWIYRPRHPQYVAIDAIEEAGGYVELQRPGAFGPVFRVRRGYGKWKIGDAEMKYLSGFEHLKELDLGDTRVSDVGLEHARGLKELEVLNLNGTRITDAGLANLEGMSKLRGLYLHGTAVTDTGLTHLQKLSQLESLGLRGTAVTEQGVIKLKETLPNVHVFYGKYSESPAKNPRRDDRR
jgi:Leucine-rich repeat (LRR) protein